METDVAGKFGHRFVSTGQSRSLEELDVLRVVRVPQVHGAEDPGKPIEAAL